MRKFILISALLLASASAQAGEGRGLVLAANDTPALTETAKPENRCRARGRAAASFQAGEEGPGQAP